MNGSGSRPITRLPERTSFGCVVMCRRSTGSTSGAPFRWAESVWGALPIVLGISSFGGDTRGERHRSQENHLTNERIHVIPPNIISACLTIDQCRHRTANNPQQNVPVCWSISLVNIVRPHIGATARTASSDVWFRISSINTSDQRI